MRNANTAWEFKTDRFRIALEIELEDLDPADYFEFEEDIESVRSGAVEWFHARVVVYLDGREIGSDSLGACAYETIREFYTSHRDPNPMNRNCAAMRTARGGSPDAKFSICHYFPGMVSEAIADARRNLSDIPPLRGADLYQRESA